MVTGTPVVLVHGFWLGSWSWSLVAEELAARGVASVAVDLEGHGLHQRSPDARWARPFDTGAFRAAPSPVASVTASSATARLIEQIRRIGGGRPCVLVAHSMAGVVATAAAEQAPELVAGVVYVAAFVPLRGGPAAEYIGLPEMEGSLVMSTLVADPATVGALRLDLGDTATRAQLQETIYNDLDPAAAAAAISLMSSDAPAGIAGEPITASRERFGMLPHTYVVCTLDNTVRPALQRLTVDEIDAVSTRPTEVVELEASHAPLLSMPDRVADVIASVHARVDAATGSPV